jgi:hypothetical protein
MDNAVVIAEMATSEFAASVVDEIAKKHTVSGLSVVSFVPGLVHNHPPCDFIMESCSYCTRNGNIFSSETSPKDSDDIIFKYRAKIIDIFEDMKKEILEITETNMNLIDDDDDLEKMLMKELS